MFWGNYTSVLRSVSVQEMSGNITFILKLVLCQRLHNISLGLLIVTE